MRIECPTCGKINYVEHGDTDIIRELTCLPCEYKMKRHTIEFEGLYAMKKRYDKQIIWGNLTPKKIKRVYSELDPYGEENWEN